VTILIHGILEVETASGGSTKPKIQNSGGAHQKVRPQSKIKTLVLTRFFKINIRNTFPT
jgi:hypothetical protein